MNTNKVSAYLSVGVQYLYVNSLTEALPEKSGASDMERVFFRRMSAAYRVTHLAGLTLKL